MDQKQKQTLTDARSYGGAETSSDHRLVVARMELNWPLDYMIRDLQYHKKWIQNTSYKMKMLKMDIKHISHMQCNQ